MKKKVQNTTGNNANTVLPTGRLIMETLTVEQFVKKYDCCPICGSDYGVYTKVKTKGAWEDTTLFSGTKENTEMMDSFVDTWESKHIFCKECRKPVAIRAEM